MRKSLLVVNPVPPNQSKRPALAILSMNDAVGFGTVLRLEFDGVPNQLLAGAISHIAEVIRFRQPAGILEVRAARFARAAGGQPFFVMAGDAWDRRRGALEADEIFFRQQ